MELIRVETRALLPRPHEEAHDRQFRLTKFIGGAAVADSACPLHLLLCLHVIDEFMSRG